MNGSLNLAAGWDIVPAGRLLYARRREATVRFPRRPAPLIDLLHILKEAAHGLCAAEIDDTWSSRLKELGLLQDELRGSVASRRGLTVGSCVRDAQVLAPESGEYWRLPQFGRLRLSDWPTLAALRAGQQVFFGWATCAETLDAIRTAAVNECERCCTYGDVVVGQACVTGKRWPGPSGYWCSEDLHRLAAVLTQAPSDPDRVFCWSPSEGARPLDTLRNTTWFLAEAPEAVPATATVYCARAMCRTADLAVNEHSWAPWSTGAAESCELAKLICQMEAAETYAVSAFSPAREELVRASWRELGVTALDPAELGIPAGTNRESLRTMPTLWCRGHAVLSEDERWVPLQKVGHRRVEGGSRLPLLPASSIGVAAHTKRSAALNNAMLELCEREALLTAWVNGLELPRVSEGSLDPASCLLAEQLRDRGYEPIICDATMDLVSVILVFGFDRTGAGRILLKGSAAAEEPLTAIRRALLEAHTAYHFNAGQAFEVPHVQEVTTPRDHIAFHSRSDRATRLRAWVESGPIRQAAELVRRELWSSVQGAGLTPVYCDLHSQGFAGISVVRVLAPGLVPLAYGNVPIEISRRHLEVPKQLGKVASSAAPGVVRGPIHPFG